MCVRVHVRVHVCVCVARGQADRSAEADIIVSAVIKAVLFVLIGVINVLRVRFLTHTQTFSKHVHLHTRTHIHTCNYFNCGIYSQLP